MWQAHQNIATLRRTGNVNIKIPGKMEELLKFAETKIAVNIYSSPNFALETFLVVFVCFIFGAIIVHLKQLTKKKPNNCAPPRKELALMPVSATSSSDTLCTGMAYADSASGTRSITLRESPSKKYDFLTVEEFMQRYSENRAVKSLRSLCNEVLEKKSSEKTIRRHLEMAKEHLQLAKCSLGSGDDDQQMVKVTDSLFELLHRIILSSSSTKPFPFRGDMAALAAEIADLSLDVDPADGNCFSRSSDERGTGFNCVNVVLQ